MSTRSGVDEIAIRTSADPAGRQAGARETEATPISGRRPDRLDETRTSVEMHAHVLELGVVLFGVATSLAVQASTGAGAFKCRSDFTWDVREQ